MTKEPPIVMLVDDDEGDAFLLRKAFATGPRPVIFAHVLGGEDLLAHLAAARAGSSARAPQLILLDVNMPAMDGFQVLRALRHDEFARAIPVVVFTTSSLEEDVERAYAGGAGGYFVKPSSLADLNRFVSAFDKYWFDGAKLPSSRAGGSSENVARIETPR